MTLQHRTDRRGRDRILTAPAIAFVEDLARRFRPRIDEVARAPPRDAKRASTTATASTFSPRPLPSEAATGRSARSPPILQDRRVEITGPVDRKMIINALNSGANVFMADFEDATSPIWANLVSGQANLMDAVRRTDHRYAARRPASVTPLLLPLATLMDSSTRWLPSPEKHFVRRRTARARDAGRFRVPRLSQRSRAE